LTLAADAILVDTTRLSAHEVAESLLDVVNGHLAAVQRT
jgi:cytidylate kinase